MERCSYFILFEYRTEVALNKKNCLEGVEPGKGLPHFFVPSWF